MTRPGSRFDPRSSTAVFYVSVAVYVVVTLALAGRYRYSLYPDATSYLSIAQAYARGQFWDAVNGYWAPLYCWLLAPLLAAGVDRLLAPKVLALVIGTFTLIGLRRLCRRLNLGHTATSMVLIAALPSLICWSLIYVTPDFLLVCVLTWYLSEVLGWSPASGVRAGLAAGALGGLAYLSKQYALPFVVAHLMLAATLHYHQYRTRTAAIAIRRWGLAAYVALLVVGGPWAVAMSTKYGRLTVATSGTYNWYLPATGFNVGTRTLAPPPFPGAVSAWVDPTPYAHTAPSRADPARNANPTVPRWWGVTAALHQAQRDALRLERFSALALPLLAAAVVLAVRDARRHADYRYAQLALAFTLYFGGYAIATAWMEERLVWIVVILLATLGALLLQRFAIAVPLGPGTRAAAAMLLVLSFWPLPVLRTAQGLDDGRELHETARRLERYGVQGRLATLNRYADSLRVAFLGGSAFYGRIAQPLEIETVLGELHAHQIDFLLIWDEERRPESTRVHRALRERFRDVTQGELAELSILDTRTLTAGRRRRED